MKKSVIIFVVSLMVYVRSARVNAETVWLKDVTTGLQTDKRLISDLDLPDAVTFTLSRGSQALNLNLMRNHHINPNADVHVLEKLKDGRFHATKSLDLGQADLAYYQDVENGAFMTVRCLRANGKCNRVINGNIRIEGKNYDLRPAETVVALRNVLENPKFLGIKYVLKEQGEANNNRRNVGKEYIEQVQMLRRGQNKQNQFLRQDATMSFRNIADFQERGKEDEVHNLKRNYYLRNYYVEMGILVDSAVWDLHYSLVEMSDEVVKEVQVKRNIREYFSHIINGVDLLYKGIQSKKMSITVTLLEFFFYKKEQDFEHILSSVVTDGGVTFIEVDDYLEDLRQWDMENAFFAKYDHAMLFTGHNLYDEELLNNGVIGRSFTGHVCDIGERTAIVEIGDFFQTVSTAAHELGHNLGADHDGEGSAVDCPADDMHIMSPKTAVFEKDKDYSRKPWLFSNCSMKAIKRTLKRKTCVSNIGGFYDKEEWTKNVMRLPGEAYTPSHQCKLIKGPNSDFCGIVSDDICLFMECTNPLTGNCLQHRFVAARGTTCGPNKWCLEGMCITKFATFEDESNDLER